MPFWSLLSRSLPLGPRAWGSLRFWLQFRQFLKFPALSSPTRKEGQGLGTAHLRVPARRKHRAGPSHMGPGCRHAGTPAPTPPPRPQTSGVSPPGVLWRLPWRRRRESCTRYHFLRQMGLERLVPLYSAVGQHFPQGFCLSSHVS